MRITRLVVAEILGRPLSFLLCLSVVAVAAILFIAGPTILGGYAEQTQRQLRSLQEETDAALAAMQGETDTMLAEMDKKTTRIMIWCQLCGSFTKTTSEISNGFRGGRFPEDTCRNCHAPQVETIVHLTPRCKRRSRNAHGPAHRHVPG
jgi:hypothetical protein